MKAPATCAEQTVETERSGADTGPHDLSRIREELGMTREQLAEVAGVTQEELAEMEAGTRPVPHELVAEIMEELNAKGA